MRIIKSSFFWQFSGGFLLGAFGLFVMQPAEAKQAVKHDVANLVHARR